ncbi:hypothetical protein GBA52_022880 [Prunus armeniaca]|nr:hypothetical protein GBA52_022880 [Prunus armeniaca]
MADNNVSDSDHSVLQIKDEDKDYLAGAVLDIRKARHAGQGGQPVLTRFFYSNQDTHAFQ